jgi:beta-phosphoglucomutase
MTIRGFIFDLDGVLTDTAEYHYLGWQRLADELGINFSREQNEALRGVSRRQSLELLLAGRKYPEAEMQAMMERKNRYYIEMLDRITPNDLLPGVRHLLDELHTAGIKIALGSASKNAPEVVRRLGIGPDLDAVADGSSVIRPKPAPDLFVYAAGMLRIPVAECVVVEDATAGIEASHASGMRAIGIGPTERVGQAELVLPDLSHVTLADILAHFNS